MTTSRHLEAADLALLELSLSHDEFHKNTTVDFFCQPDTITNVYEDEDGPVFFVRGSTALRLDIQFVDNGDKRRNITTMLAGIGPLIENAKTSGYTEIIFNSNSPGLIAFCKRLGFQESNGELRKIL